MIIQTLGKSYTVVKYCYSDSNMERFLCREENKNERYTVICIKNKLWITHTMEYLMKQSANVYFEDFVTCFTGDECFYVVMKYADGIILEEKLANESCSRQERFAIGKAILERIMILKTPDYFLQDCLTPDTIVLANGTEAAFHYTLQKLNDYEHFHFSDVQKRLYQIFIILFQEELKRKTMPFAAEFCSRLKSAGYKDILEIYTEYTKMLEQAEGMQEEEFVVPKTFVFRLWERVKKCIPAFKRICAVLLMIAAVAFLIYSFQQSMQEGGEKKVFDSIGTLEIREGGEK